MLDIGIIIVNWNTRDLLCRCLESIYSSAGALNYKVVVVDNASTDGSVEMVQSRFPQVAVSALPDNLGYPAANNVGLRELGFERSTGKASDELLRYALLLNPDTELEPSSLADMLAFLDHNPGVGVAGPKLILPDGSLDLACRRSFPSPEVSLWRIVGFSKLFPRNRRFARYNLTFLDENQTTEVDSVVGAFMMVRSECIHKVGLLDDNFFMYGEDLDWCKRIKEAGWKVMYYPEVHVLHVKRAASRKSKRAQFEFVRAMLLFYNKHYRDSTGWLMNLAVLGGIALQGGPRLWPEIPHHACTGGR